MRKLRAWASSRVHRVLGAALTSALNPIDAQLRQIDARVASLGDAVERDRVVMNERLSSLEGLASRIELEEQALRQQVDEALDFLRVQHFAVREALDVTSALRTSRPPAEPGATSGD
jgi:hypothetical protein